RHTRAFMGDLNMADAALTGSTEPTGTVQGGMLGSKSFGWAMFEWARNPYYNVVVIFTFAPYFAASIVGDKEQGQILTSLLITIAGIIMAIVSPILGSVVDNAGRKKPFIFIVLTLLALCSIGLGFITPDFPFAIPLAMALMIVGYCSYTISELLHNAMLPGAAAPKSLPLVSGLGLAMGNAAGMIFLVTIALTSQNPPFGLTEQDISRLSAAVVGVWLLLFIPVFFWLMPDVFKTGATWSKALSDFRNPANRVSPVKWITSRFQQHPNVMRYLVGRMIYADGIAALLTIGGVYITGVLQWNAQQLAVYGIIASLMAIVGAFTGGLLDRTFGPKRALTIELSAAIMIGIFQLSITENALLFGLIPAGHDIWSGPVFTRLSDVAYLAAIIPGTIFLVGAISSSRYMLLHISPPEKVGEFFGFYAMSGSVTVWLGPGSVALVTWLSGDQRAGFAPVLFLLATGLAIILTVKADKTPEHMKTEAEA
ncbi:MAG: MFS transporter, partial [Pseudomonadota bacterium]